MKAMNSPIWHEYQDLQAQIHTWHPVLEKVHAQNTFCYMTVNFGLQTVCWVPLNHGNWAGGWCVISAWENFDPTGGRHIVLWNLGLVIEFPVGSSIFIPLVLIPHSNMPVQPGETWYSVTSWMASRLFRWVYNGFQTDKQWEETATEEDCEHQHKDGNSRWEESLKLFPQLKPHAMV